jgi:hypothetical protein
MILYTHYLKSHHRTHGNLEQRATSVLDDAADVAYRVAETYLATEKFDNQHGDIPPFMLSWMYMATVYLVGHGHANGISQYDDKVKVIENVLHKLSEKWNLACKIGLCIILLKC